MAQFILESLPTPAAPPPQAPGGFVLESLPGSTSAPPAEQPGVVEDVLKSAGSGVVRGVAMLPGVIGDAASGIEWLAEKVARKIYGDAQVDKVKAERAATGGSGPVDRAFRQNVPTSSSMNELARAYAPGADYDPKTTTGEYARTVGEFAPNAVAGPGRVVGNLLKYGVGAGLASEGAGQATEGTAYEPYARVAGAIVGGVAPTAARAVLPGSMTTEKAIRDAMQGMTPAQINDAARIMATAQNAGIQLTWPEALRQATGSSRPTPMSGLQRIAESTPEGQTVLGPIMTERPGQVAAAVGNQLDAISPAPANVSQVGPRAAANAEGAIEDVRRDINTQTRPLYDAARTDLIAPPDMAPLMALPGWDDAVAAVRGNPQKFRHVQGLPENSVIFVDAVKKELSEAGERAANPLQPGASQTVAAGNRQDAAQLQQTATNASVSLADALAEQARLRAAQLTPLQQGQLGDIARSEGTRAAGEALLPPTPLPGLAGETGRTTATLAARDAQGTAELVRTRLEDQFTRSAKDVQGGANQMGGAQFRKDVYGTAPLRENLNAALSGLPNGQQLTDGFESLMTSLEATGKRDAAGSLTAFNQEALKTLSGGSAAADTVAGALQPTKIFGFAQDRIKQWQLGRNMRELAAFITDPANQQRLIELAGMRSGAPERAALQAQLAASIAERENTDTARQSLIDAMLQKGKTP